jgi:hypothetical protein
MKLIEVIIIIIIIIIQGSSTRYVVHRVKNRKCGKSRVINEKLGYIVQFLDAI